ncbi:hypothetical protein M407DRAFT_51324, partial [Tulasnella calospora MUT 4182]
SAPTDAQITTLKFYPGFSAYNDELYEQYLDHTVLSGLSKTGGLYTVFDVMFVFLFGRSLLAAMRGSKHITPFGAMASIIYKDKFRKGLQEGYPGIDGKDPSQRAEATCSFVHDFILNIKP